MFFLTGFVSIFIVTKYKNCSLQKKPIAQTSPLQNEAVMAGFISTQKATGSFHPVSIAMRSKISPVGKEVNM